MDGGAFRRVGPPAKRPATVLAVLFAVAVLVSPGVYVWCVSDDGHGMLENLLLGHCSAGAGHCGSIPAPPEPGCADLTCGHEVCSSCTDIPVEYPLVFSAAPDLPGLAPAQHGPASEGEQPDAGPWFGSPPPGGGDSQALLVLAATVLLC